MEKTIGKPTIERDQVQTLAERHGVLEMTQALADVAQRFARQAVDHDEERGFILLAQELNAALNRAESRGLIFGVD